MVMMMMMMIVMMIDPFVIVRCGVPAIKLKRSRWQLLWPQH